jgi:hypothetical protein
MSDRPPSSSSARYISDKHTCIDVGAQDRTYVIKSWEIEVHLSNDSDAELTNSNKGTHFQKCVLKCQCALLNGSGKHATLFASQERGDQKYIIRCSQPPLKPATNQPSLQPMLVRHRHGHPHALWAHLAPRSFSSCVELSISLFFSSPNKFRRRAPRPHCSLSSAEPTNQCDALSYGSLSTLSSLMP